MTTTKAKSNTAAFKGIVLAPEDTHGLSTWGFIVLPKTVSDRLPRRGRITVNAAINGDAFQIMLEPDGQLSHWFRVDLQVLAGASLEMGDAVDVQIAPLLEEPPPTPPADFAKALASNAGAKSVWDCTSAIAQVDWIHWIESSKQTKTRIDRIRKACNMLESGKKRVCCFDPSGFYSKALSAPRAKSLGNL